MAGYDHETMLRIRELYTREIESDADPDRQLERMLAMSMALEMALAEFELSLLPNARELSVKVGEVATQMEAQIVR